MNIVVKSRFNPFTYEELVKPLEDYTKAYNEVAAQYDTLAAQTEAFRDIASRETNPEAYAMFNGYANDLETVLDDFSKGMTMSNRSQLMGLKRRYAKEIAPIARAEAARQETEKYRRDIKAKDNSVEFKTENFSLDNFLHGRTVNNDYISGKEVLARSSAKAEALGKTLFTDPEFKKILGGQQYQIYQQNGITPEMLGMVINDQLDNPNISESLRSKLQGFRQIIDDEMTAVADWGDSAKQRVYNNAVTGIYAGLAKPKYTFKDNKNFISAASRVGYSGTPSKKDSSTGNNNLIYRLVPKTTVGDTQWGKDLEKLIAIMGNPEILNETKVSYTPSIISPTTGAGLGSSVSANSPSIPYYPNQDFLKELSKKLGMDINYKLDNGMLRENNFEEVAKELARRSEDEVFSSNSYLLNITNSDLVNQVIKENSESYFRRSGKTGLKKYEDGKVTSDDISKKDISTFTAGEGHLEYEPNVGLVWSNTDKKGNPVYAVIDPALLDDPTGRYRRRMALIDSLMEKDENTEAARQIDMLMNELYMQFNTLAKKQGETDSKI